MDKFFTKKEVAKECIDLIDLSQYKMIVEPSAGSGNFYFQIDHVNKIGMDIEPDHDKIIKRNWFDFSDDLTSCLVIGNPPFGKRNLLSKEFIKHAIKLNAQTIAFVLPDVYHKHTLQSIFPKSYRLIHYIKLPGESFTVNEKSYNLPCSFFIWDKSEGEDLRFDPSKIITQDFSFVAKSKANENCFFIMGASPNTVKELHEVSPTNRGYYIQPEKKSKQELISAFKKINFKALSSASGNVAWRTKPEIIQNYNQFTLDMRE